MSPAGGVCPYIWTPFSDEQSEGYFINVNNDTETTFQLWVKVELNGDADENFLEIVVAEKALNDAPETSGNCGSCIISSSLLLKLDGRCRDSLIGGIRVAEVDTLSASAKNALNSFVCAYLLICEKDVVFAHITKIATKK